MECTLVLAQNSLLSQSRADLRGESHPDGWGISVYENGSLTVERRDTAAFEDVHFSVTAERVYGRTVIAHVRDATVGGAVLSNTHPFVYGSWTFAHNGTIREFEKVRSILEPEMSPALAKRRLGDTDSEFAFYWILDRLAREGIDIEHGCGDPEAAAGVLGDCVRRLDSLCVELGAEKPARLNFVLTDGETLLATRARNSLYWAAREGIHDCEICGIPHVHHREGREYRAVVVASEPISKEKWQEVPEGGMVVVDSGVGAVVQGLWG